MQVSHKILVDNPARLYLAAWARRSGEDGDGGGVFLSTDAGRSWHMIDNGLPPGKFSSSIIIDPEVPATLYVGYVAFTTGIGGVVKSTDGGETWIALPPLPANTSTGSLVIDPAAPSTLYAVASSFTPPGPPSWHILKSTDGGEHWNTYDAGLPPNTFITSLALDPATAGVFVGYAGAFQKID